MKVPTIKDLEAMSLEEVEAVRRDLEAHASELRRARQVVARIAEHKGALAAAAARKAGGAAHEIGVGSKK